MDPDPYYFYQKVYCFLNSVIYYRVPILQTFFRGYKNCQLGSGSGTGRIRNKSAFWLPICIAGLRRNRKKYLRIRHSARHKYHFYRIETIGTHTPPLQLCVCSLLLFLYRAAVIPFFLLGVIFLLLL